MKVIGIIPARMAASRFPGKPLYPIHGKPMLEHVYCRAKMYSGWDHLVVATCDQEIEQFSKSKSFPVVMTGNHHTRALDRVAEAMTLLDTKVADDDIIVCVQGDEPMMRPDMIEAAVAPLLSNSNIPCTVLAMHIVDKEIWLNPDTVKIIHNAAGEVLYTSRAPLPYCKGEFSHELMARRIYGIFAFRSKYLKQFTEHSETRLEQLEACDSNRILDMSFAQFIAPYPNIESFSVDSPEDIQLVEKYMLSDSLWKEYN
ncbi:3-deoxy-manno-octulosonate cytidylyltransferase [Leptospira stimsonii]|uniref:3-deoxy-manno-octulosonate cytidylyltransferase n=1 Tax=Leptospira stimsonii TaxID=2202203 RepID=A0A396Z9K7_9LEPT|nr:3-deoxy-manno-octulosonate cytidylyltransferase [Leptospira stimsonii]RHX90863.1 3-deoxy-manno-octulosonate cytidylyltransferase [Leptospira stimsonii]